MPENTRLKQLAKLDLIDSESLDRYLKSSIDLKTLERLSAAFEKDAVRIITNLKPLASNTPSSTVELIAEAHALRGIAGSVCAVRLERIANEIEEASRQDTVDWPHLVELIDQLPFQLSETLIALDNYMKAITEPH